jgi:competence protein ComEA
MKQAKGKTWWLYPIIILLIAIIAGGVILVSQHTFGGNQPLEITPPESSTSTVEVYLSGEINNPGFYTFEQGSSLEEVWQKAGGLSEEADLSNIKIEILSTNESSIEQPQKININTAEPWLLDALWGIGEEGKAQAIVKYREDYLKEHPEEHRCFKQPEDLMNVTGIGPAIFEKNKDKITV